MGGRARFFVEAQTVDDVADAITYARSSGLELFVLGGGSNVVIADEGFDGLVLQIAVKGVVFRGDESSILDAGAGESWDGVVKTAVERGLAGLECLSGIPGLVGGTPIQNVGAYGQDVSETIVSVRCLDRETGEIVELSNSDCCFTYRSSIFNTTMKNQYVVLGVRYRLDPGGGPKISYRDLLERFGDRRPGLAETRDAVLSIRAEKAMVIDENDVNSRSVGSFFKNPIVNQSTLDSIEAVAAPTPVPHFPAGEGRSKVPAAWLIEQAGFRKGFVHGNAGISAKHALALINRGKATAAEIVSLRDMIAGRVCEQFGIELVPEPVFVGFK